MDILNRHPQFWMRGEIHRDLIVALDQLVQTAEACHAGKWTEPNFRKARLRLILENIRLLGKGGASPGWPGRVERYRIGFKMPYVELVKPSLDNLLKPEFDGVDFLYCVRGLEQNFLSQKSKLGIKKKQFIANTIASIDAFNVMNQDDFYRVQILHLDQYLASDDRPGWLCRNLFGFLGVDGTSDEDVESYIASTPNRNKTPGKDRLRELEERERQAISGNKALLERIRWLQQHHSINLELV
ncbi:hypothetical protein [Wenzhouxiangella sp. EGI_FJ10305]|uniref:hypothetical protein n=1 Tax=Wenzhouxiangella sp. EGI_FJ10305 TaxID=3243768 RepID=UPI0035DAB683